MGSIPRAQKLNSEGRDPGPTPTPYHILRKSRTLGCILCELNGLIGFIILNWGFKSLRGRFPENLSPSTVFELNA